jgi:hypothetical protein
VAQGRRGRLADRGLRLRHRGGHRAGRPRKSRTGEWTIGDGQPGEVTLRLRSALLDLQYGRTQDGHGWMKRVGD